MGPNDKAGFQELGSWLFVRTVRSGGRVLGASGVRWGLGSLGSPSLLVGERTPPSTHAT